MGSLQMFSSSSNHHQHPSSYLYISTNHHFLKGKKLKKSAWTWSSGFSFSSKPVQPYPLTPLTVMIDPLLQFEIPHIFREGDKGVGITKTRSYWETISKLPLPGKLEHIAVAHHVRQGLFQVISNFHYQVFWFCSLMTQLLSLLVINKRNIN